MIFINLKTIIMKTLGKFWGLAVIMIVLFTACADDEETNDRGFDGTYTGTLTGSQIKSSDAIGESKQASAEVSITGKNEIRIHCLADGFDTTFRLHYYHHNDSAYVCYTGNDFERMYGHMLGEGHTGHMMDDKHNGESDWMHHMKEEHQNGAHHFGGFNLNNHHFSYTFDMHKGDTSDDLHFEGIRN